jgi:hypothetical protein
MHSFSFREVFRYHISLAFMNRGQSIRIFLADGTVTGVRHAAVVNWTGQAVACPRNRVGERKDWEEAQRPGVYLLFGMEEETGRPAVYIGEAEHVLDRTQDHLANKDFRLRFRDQAVTS